MKTGTGYCILIVDDEPDVTQMLAKLLAEHGFETYTVNNPLKAVEKAAAVRPDLIILDFIMPQLPGSEVARMLRGYSATGDVPILFLSGARDEDLRLIAKVSGATAFLEKPVDVAQLLEKIRGLLGAGS